MPVVWLVVQAYLAGQPSMLIENVKQPSISACLERAAAILEGAANVAAGDGFEIAVTCSVAKDPERPVKEESQ
jgi:hypothetical protein